MIAEPLPAEPVLSITQAYILAGLLAALGGCATPISRPQETALTQIRLGETARLPGLRVTPIAIVEDSRCPLDVHCIQAGTVRIQTRIVDSGVIRAETLALDVPLQLTSGWVRLVQTCPQPAQASQIRPGDYLFSLMLSRATNPPVIEAPECPRALTGR